MDEQRGFLSNCIRLNGISHGQQHVGQYLVGKIMLEAKPSSLRGVNMSSPSSKMGLQEILGWENKIHGSGEAPFALKEPPTLPFRLRGVVRI